MANIVEPRFLRGGCCCDEDEFEAKDCGTDVVETECVMCILGDELTLAWSRLPTECEARTSFGGALLAGDRSLEYR